MAIVNPFFNGLIEPYLKGFLLHNQNVSLFDFGNVLVQKKYRENQKVRIISGGSCAHYEYVGQGMLTASVQGFSNHSPPPPNVIFKTIQELGKNHDEGILIIIQESSSDYVSFGLAVERAQNEDIEVELLTVADSNTDKLNKQAGLCGIVLLNKIAGALAEMETFLFDIYDYCNNVLSNIITSDINIKNILVKSRECFYCEHCITGNNDGAMSNGINKYPKRIKIQHVMTDVVQRLFDNIIQSKKFALNSEDKLVVLVNHLGIFNKEDEYVLVNEIFAYIQSINFCRISRIYIGNYLNIKNGSDLFLTILKVFDGRLISYLDAPCNAPGWKPVYQTENFISSANPIPGSPVKMSELIPPIKGPYFTEKYANVFQLCLQFACDALISCEKMLNTMDMENGNGDAGTRFKATTDVINQQISEEMFDTLYPFTFFSSLSRILENTVGSSLSCIYSILFEAAAKKFGEYNAEDEITLKMWLEALENGCNAIKKYCNIKFGEKTMIDPLERFATIVRDILTNNYENLDDIGIIEKGVMEAENVLESTKQPDSRFPDPGAQGVVIWLRAVYEGVKIKMSQS